jgi:hypothetical protein
MKTVIRVILRIVGGLLSPTWVLAEYLKPVGRNAAATFMRSWNLAFLFVASVVWLLLCAIEVGDRWVAWLLPVYLWVLPFGRANEIFYAFLRDGFERIKGTPEETGLTPYDRIVLISRSYLEVIVDFELLAGAHAVEGAALRGQRIPLLDDLYQSGATFNAIARVIKEQGGASAVFALALTRARG